MAEQSAYDSFSDCLDDQMSKGLSRPEAIKVCHGEHLAGVV